MKIIYVDIDGPLATDDSAKIVEKTKWHPKLYRMDSKCVTVLNEIITETGCELVVSSDWRVHFNLTELGEIFEWNGVIKKPVNVTPQECISFSDKARNRIHQIKLSINEIKPEKWVSIDDLPLGQQYYSTGLPCFVECEPIAGISREGIKESILKFLN